MHELGGTHQVLHPPSDSRSDPCPVTPEPQQKSKSGETRKCKQHKHVVLLVVFLISTCHALAEDTEQELKVSRNF